MQKHEIPTPALVIDRDKLENNMRLMAAFFAGKTAKLRPHYKTHKCPILAQRQVALGAIGLTCAKLGEAETLVAAGIRSILIANQIVDPAKIARLAQLERQSQIIVAVDNPANLQMLSAAAFKEGVVIPVVIEVNVGMNRCGVENAAAALALARQALALPGVRFSGLLGYEGQTVLEPDAARRAQNANQAMSILVGTADYLRAADVPVEIVSAGGTGTYALTGAFPGVTEIEAGSYLFMDTKYRSLGLPFENALHVLGTVISVPAAGRAVIDVGMKAVTHENGLPEVIAPGGVCLKALAEEHGILELTPGASIELAQRVELLPSHICTTVNLHEQYYVLRGDTVEEIWPITARGKFQ